MFQLDGVFGVKPEEVDEFCSGINLSLNHSLTLTNTERWSIYTQSWNLHSSWASDNFITYLSDHGLGQNFCSLGSAYDVGGFEEDLCSIRDGFEVPFSACSHGGLDGFIYQLLKKPNASNHEERTQIAIEGGCRMSSSRTLSAKQNLETLWEWLKGFEEQTKTMYLNILMDRKLFNITWNMDYCITACSRLFGGFCLCLLLCIIQVLINTWMMKSHKTMKDELTDSWYLISLVQTSSFPTTHGISSVLPFSSCNACRTQQTE